MPIPEDTPVKLSERPEQPSLSTTAVQTEQLKVEAGLQAVVLPHPDAQFQGKNAESFFEVDGTKYKVSIFVDGRDPREWGLNPTTLECSPLIIHGSRFPNLQAVLALSNALTGPLASAIRDCLGRMGFDTRGY